MREHGLSSLSSSNMSRGFNTVDLSPRPPPKVTWFPHSSPSAPHPVAPPPYQVAPPPYQTVPPPYQVAPSPYQVAPPPYQTTPPPVHVKSFLRHVVSHCPSYVTWFRLHVTWFHTVPHMSRGFARMSRGFGATSRGFEYSSSRSRRTLNYPAHYSTSMWVLVRMCTHSSIPISIGAPHPLQPCCCSFFHVAAYPKVTLTLVTSTP